MNASAIHAELLRLLARRGELTADLDQTDVAIARHRGMFETCVAIQADANAAPTPAVDSTPASSAP